MTTTPPNPPARSWPRLATRILRLLLKPSRTASLVQSSYDRIAAGYDDAWTRHMRGLTLALLDRLRLPPGAACLDLTCGTGFITRELALRAGTRPTGVDASPGMLDIARRQHGAHCDFVQADAAAYVRSCPTASRDVITCGWGLGYTRPWRVIRDAARVLRPGGRLAIIDNSLFSLAGVLWCSILAFAEAPEALAHVMRVRFLPNSAALAALMRFHGLAVLRSYDGSHTYFVPTGQSAIDRLTVTGAAAGFESAALENRRDQVFARFAKLIEQRYSTPAGIPITHRYLAAIGEKR